MKLEVTHSLSPPGLGGGGMILTAEGDDGRIVLSKEKADRLVAEIVTATELRFTDFRESFLAGELLGLSTH